MNLKSHLLGAAASIALVTVAGAASAQNVVEPVQHNHAPVVGQVLINTTGGGMHIPNGMNATSLAVGNAISINVENAAKSITPATYQRNRSSAPVSASLDVKVGNATLSGPATINATAQAQGNSLATAPTNVGSIKRADINQWNQGQITSTVSVAATAPMNQLEAVSSAQGNNVFIKAKTIGAGDYIEIEQDNSGAVTSNLTIAKGSAFNVLANSDSKINSQAVGNLISLEGTGFVPHGYGQGAYNISIDADRLRQENMGKITANLSIGEAGTGGATEFKKVEASARAIGNVISLTGKNSDAAHTSVEHVIQKNSGAVSANAVIRDVNATSADFSAVAVGNSLSLTGATVNLGEPGWDKYYGPHGVSQLNTAPVTATMTGGGTTSVSGVYNVTAAAMGNVMSATGTSYTDYNLSQTNMAQVTAVNTFTTTGLNAGTLNVSAQAVGNSFSFTLK
ncbi:MAG TPA: hypothetical protein VEY95_17305 [Azospirillaceae bacterium]|nr:hypothetical protein [Azospirillaceae bacterium]